jgi:hypothetical protein
LFVVWPLRVVGLVGHFAEGGRLAPLCEILRQVEFRVLADQPLVLKLVF